MRRAAIPLALIALPSFALAQDLAPLSYLKACRLDPSTISLEFGYDGSACEHSGKARADLIERDAATVTVPTVAISDVCTMQVVALVFAGTVSVPETVSKLDVQVLSPSGEVVAAGGTEIAASGSSCSAPEA